ncbi:MAG TPA: HD-GYP domain-containing protein [Solirubrobacteraceae bacterium]|nr:HD-GYP domain-containing protein [Solirubrobacteraceae bacterium]
MVGKLNFEEQELLADTFARAEADFTPREALIELPVAVGFFAAVAVVWAAWPPHGFELLPCVLCLVVMAFASIVRFDTPFGFTLATQLAFVPLLFAMPVAAVPLAVLAALLLAGAFEVWRGNLRPLRLLLIPGNSWFAIGPVAVFAVAHTEPRHAGAALLVIALAAQFAVDFGVSSLRFAEARDAGLTAQLRESWVYLIDIALTGMGLVVAEQVHEHPFVALAPLPLLGLLAWFAGERRERLVNLLELNSAYRGTALVLGDVVEADDGYTGVHCRGVLGLALAVADELGLGAEQRRNLEFGALLHDVGKIAIPKEIVNKPGKLDPEEWQIIKTHTLEGQNMLDRIGGFMHDVGLIVRSHHERWDGGGYPDGLKGEEIPLEARIVTCCDSWNAMRTDRAYRKALPSDLALAELSANSGRQFDPRIVEVVTSIVGTAAEQADPSAELTAMRGTSPSLVAG